MSLLLLACTGGGPGPLGGDDSGSDSFEPSDFGACGAFHAVDQVGASWSWRYDDPDSYPGSWTQVIDREESGVFVQAVYGTAQPEGRDAYTWTSEWQLSCDEQGVYQVGGWSRIEDTIDGTTQVAEYGYEYLEPGLLWARDPAVGDSWEQRLHYQVRDLETGEIVGDTYDHRSTHEVIEQGSVSVTAGTFEGLRVQTGTDEYPRYYWLVEGIGLVQWEDFSELTAFSPG